MMGARWIRVVAVAVTFCLAQSAFWDQSVRAVEPWADGKLAPRDGLELWLDARQVAVAREAAGLSKLKSGESLSEWHDASGAKRNVM